MDLARATTTPAMSDPWARFDRPAGMAFVAAAVLGLVALLAVAGLGQTATIEPAWLETSFGRPLLLAVAIAALVVDIAVLYSVGAGLDRSATWARPAAVNVLVVVAALGLLQVAVDLTRGRLTIPFAALVALWLLSRRPGPAGWVVGRDRAIVAGITLVAVVTLLPSVIPWWLLGG
jgi:hypothetical protein